MSNPSDAAIFPASPQTPRAPEYEFGDAENKVFTALAAGMRFVGTAQVVTGALEVLVAVVHVWLGGAPSLVSAVPMALSAGMLVMTGAWLRRASEPVARIVSTQGSDIRNLMEAMAGLARMFALQRVYFLFVGGLTAAALVGAVLALVFFARVFASLMS